MSKPVPDGLSPEARRHLAHVYSILTVGAVVATIAAFIPLFFVPHLAGWVITFAVVGAIGTALGIYWIRQTPEDQTGKRVAIFMATAAWGGFFLATVAGPVLAVDAVAVLVGFVTIAAVLGVFVLAILLIPFQGILLFVAAVIAVFVFVGVVNAALWLLKAAVIGTVLGAVALIIGVTVLSIFLTWKTLTFIANGGVGDNHPVNDVHHFFGGSRSSGAEKRSLLGASAA